MSEQLENSTMIVRVRYDGSIEISHMNSRGFRHSKVYYGYTLNEARKLYKEKEINS